MLFIVKERNLVEFCDIFCEDKVFFVDESRRILIVVKELGYKLKIYVDEIVLFGGVEFVVELGVIFVEYLMKIIDFGINVFVNSNVIVDLFFVILFNLMEYYVFVRKMIEVGI